MAYHVSMTKKAKIDVSVAESWVLQISQAALVRWRARFLNALQILETDALRFPPAEEAVEIGKDIRESTFGRWPHLYRILFTIKDQHVLIVRVRHAARDSISDSDL